MSWSYRIVKEKVEGGIKYSIKEVYDNPVRCTVESIAAEAFIDDTEISKTEEHIIKEIREQLMTMLLDTTRPIFDQDKELSHDA